MFGRKQEIITVAYLQRYWQPIYADLEFINESETLEKNKPEFMLSRSKFIAKAYSNPLPSSNRVTRDVLEKQVPASLKHPRHEMP